MPKVGRPKTTIMKWWKNGKDEMRRMPKVSQSVPPGRRPYRPEAKVPKVGEPRSETMEHWSIGELEYWINRRERAKKG
jgi:hypothetical protein